MASKKDKLDTAAGGLDLGKLQSSISKKSRFDASSKQEGHETINAIIKRSMTQKIEQNVSDEDEQEEYVPTMKEKFLKNQIQIPKWTLRHNDNYRMKWDMYIMLLAMWNCISIPFDVSFEAQKNDIYIACEYFIDICFAVDIVVAFRTTFINTKTGFEIVEASKIAWNYVITGRFFVDLAASIPFENLYTWFVVIDSEAANTELKLLGLLKLVRLLRLGRIIRYMKFKQGLKVGIRMF